VSALPAILASYSATRRAESRADSAVRRALETYATYLLILVPGILVRGFGHWTLLFTHLALLIAVVLASRARPIAGVARVLRDWLPVVLILVVYVELNTVIAAMGAPHRDAVAVRWERALFPMDPSRSLAKTFPTRWVSEPLHTAYLSYYLIVFVPQLILYVQGRRRAFAGTILALSTVTILCGLAFATMPVDAPRYFGGADAPDGPVRRVVLAILAGGSSRGTAFPSMHVAASVVATVCAWRTQRPVGVVAAVLTVGLTLGAVYGGFHYAVDAVAGVVMALVALIITATVWRALPDNA
jgi:membrane-associated phospholipid phosphatase